MPYFTKVIDQFEVSACFAFCGIFARQDARAHKLVVKCPFFELNDLLEVSAWFAFCGIFPRQSRIQWVLCEL